MTTDRADETTIKEGADLITLVNVFTVAPDKQQALVDALIEATDKTMSRMPGFISANIHRSFDGKRVINYAQWRSKADFEAMMQDKEAAVHMKQVASMASFDPTLCEVVSVH